MGMLDRSPTQGNKVHLSDTLFPTHTPVPFGGDGEAPPSMAATLAAKFFSKFTRRIKPIMKVRDAMDSVYSKGYFENHYRDADKDLKKLLDKEARVAHSLLLSKEDPPCCDDEEEEEEEGNGGVVVNINLSGLLGKGA